MNLIDNLMGPHEWGYRDPVEGGFVEDDAPFRAGEALQAALEALRTVRKEMIASGNWNADDFGWPEARDKAENAIAKIEYGT